MFPVHKSADVPASLAANTSYSSKDVIDALSRDFYNKCYICEVKDPISLNVEHFKSHQNDPIKKFDWNNLFFACARCNNIKRHHFDNILDCTDPNENVLLSVRHVFPTTAYAKHIEIMPMDQRAETRETAMLISKVFNDDNTGNKDLTRVFLKKKLIRKYRVFLELTLDYDDDDTLDEEKHYISRKIKNMLKDEYEFSAFIRWAILDAPELHHFREGIF